LILLPVPRAKRIRCPIGSVLSISSFLEQDQVVFLIISQS